MGIFWLTNLRAYLILIAEIIDKKILINNTVNEKQAAQIQTK